MSDFFLEVQTREDVGKRVHALRRRGAVPGVVYGHGVPTRVLEVDLIPLQRLWQAAGESTLFDLKVDGKEPVKAIIQDVQFDPASSRILHVDFHQVRMTEKLEIDVALAFTGEPPAVKELGGTLLKVLDEVKVECLPKDLVKEIVVDTTVLKTFEDAIYIRDLALPAGLTLKDHHADDLVAQVEPPRSEEELAELDKAVEEDVSKVEKVEAPATEEEADVEAGAAKESKETKKET